jgi:hypothetical protein
MQTPRIVLTWVVLAGALALTGCAEDRIKNGQSAGETLNPSGPQIGGVRPIMKAKLANAQALLEGLTLEDFDKIRLNAHTLYELSQAAEWHVHKTVAYERFSTMFRENVSDLLQQAMKDNLEGATLAYLQMTMTCVKCHSYMRDEGLARLDDAPVFRLTAEASAAPRP